MKNCQKVRVHSILRKMYELFGSRPRKGVGRRLMASSCLAQLKGSNLSIIKARRIAGIKSQKIAGRFQWLFPTRTLEEALSSVKSKTHNNGFNDEKMSRARLEINKLLIRHQYEAPAAEAFLSLRKLKIEPRYIYRAKTSLGVQSIWKDGRSYWISPASEDAGLWVLQYLKEHGDSVKAKELYAAAGKAGWSSEVIYRAAQAQAVQLVKIEGMLYFDNRVNRHVVSDHGEDEQFMDIILEDE